MIQGSFGTDRLALLFVLVFHTEGYCYHVASLTHALTAWRLLACSPIKAGHVTGGLYFILVNLFC